MLYGLFQSYRKEITVLNFLRATKQWLNLEYSQQDFLSLHVSNELFHSFHFIDKISSQSYNNVQNIKKGYKSANEIFRGSWSVMKNCGSIWLCTLRVTCNCTDQQHMIKSGVLHFIFEMTASSWLQSWISAEFNDRTWLALVDVEHQHCM